MGLAEVLTCIFVVLELLHYIEWPWWQVLLPEEIAFGLYLLTGIAVLVFGVRAFKRR